MIRFLIIIEKAGDDYSAYFPALPGCIATGKTRKTAAKNMQDAIEIHIQGMREDGEPIPAPSASAEYISVV